VDPKTKARLDILSKPDQCLVHRLLYYCLVMPLLTDYEYDMLERDGITELGDDQVHLLNFPGSDREDDYPDELVELAYLVAFPELGG
jgi:hypothetical protein